MAEKLTGDAIGPALAVVVIEIQQNSSNPIYERPVVRIWDSSDRDWGRVKLTNGSVSYGQDGSLKKVTVDGVQENGEGTGGAKLITLFVWKKQVPENGKLVLPMSYGRIEVMIKTLEL